jgi:hypothetical protein
MLSLKRSVLNFNAVAPKSYIISQFLLQHVSQQYMVWKGFIKPRNLDVMHRGQNAILL